MNKRIRVKGGQMPHLRTWREQLGLSRQAVADKIGQLSGGEDTPDQATIAKWESGRVHSEDLFRLAQVYGTTADRLFFAPGDKRTPALLRDAHTIINGADPEAVNRWIEVGKSLMQKSTEQK